MTVSRAPVTLDQVIYQGVSWRRQYRWLPGGVAQDFTGWSAQLQIRRRHGTTVLLDLGTPPGTGITLGADGLITLRASHTLTSALPYVGRLAYDLELVDPDGEVVRLLMGTVTVSPEITVISEPTL